MQAGGHRFDPDTLHQDRIGKRFAEPFARPVGRLNIVKRDTSVIMPMRAVRSVSAEVSGPEAGHVTIQVKYTNHKAVPRGGRMFPRGEPARGSGIVCF